MNDIDIKELDKNTAKLIIVIFFAGLIGGCMVGSAYAAEINLEIIKQIESSGNPHAYNKRSGATGLYQITPICLEDYNQFHPRPLCTPPISTCERFWEMHMTEMYNPEKNYLVANWYMNTRIPQLLKHFKHLDTVENRLVSYKCGIDCVGKKLDKETRKYINKYKGRE